MAKCVECKYFKPLAIGGHGLCLLKYLEKKPDEAKCESECKEFDQRHWGDARPPEFFIEQYYREKISQRLLRYRRIEIVAIVVAVIISAVALALHFI